MKIVSPLRALLLLLLPGAQAFTTRVAPVVSPRGVSRSGTATKLAVGLFQPEIDSPNKQELLNNRHSASDWLYNVKSMPSSQVLREIRNPVLSVFGWAVFVSVAQRLLLKSRNAALQTIASKITIPATAHSFLVSAIGLLLVFRTNSAYQRFYEGRKIWEHILSLSRNLTRSIQLYSKEVGAERRQRILKLVAAFPYLLRHHIRSGCLCDNDYGKIDPDHRLLLREPSLLAVETRHDGDKQCFGGTTECKEIWRDRRECWVDRRKLPWSLFPESALLKVAKARNRPLWVCDRIGRELMSVTFTENYTTRERSALIAYVDKLSDAMGECERIHQTAVPLNYARHSLRSLTLWLFTLPFALIKDLGLLTGPVTACVAWLLFGVYQIGYSIEDPFQGSLRLSLLCDAIRRDVMEASEDLPDGGRGSAYTLEGSQVLGETVKPEQLFDALAYGDRPTALNGAKSKKSSDSTSTEHMIDPNLIDPNLINPPTFIERDGKLFVSSKATGSNDWEGTF